MGQRFGNYEIMRKLAAGGMAEVFLAKQTSLGGFERLVCIKRILPHLTQQGDFITMFQDEARIAANLTHPNVAQIYDIGEIEDSYFIAMEYVRGEDLRRVYNAEVSRGRAMPLEQAAQIIMYAAAGLDYAHRQTTIDGRPLGIVHRDISPQNILITYDGHVKIVDFGVAKAANKVTETRSGVLKGKYSYMSPEQASGDPIDARTDIFALAITLYEVTTGTRLFKRENELETLHAVIECDVTPPGQVIPDYDPALEAVLLRALSYDPDERYPTAGEMERDLERFLINREHPTSPSSLGAYMQDLFAEKLADELLFGGQPWSEDNTPDAGGRSRKVKEPESGPSPGFDAEHDDTEPTELSGLQGAVEHTAVDDEWNAPHDAATALGENGDLWGPADDHDSWGPGSSVDSMTVTTGVTRGPGGRQAGSSGAQAPAAESGSRVQRAGRSTKAPPRWLTTVAAGVLLMGAGAGLALVLTGERGGSRGPSSGPLDIDSEPRGARVEFVGLGADAINARYSGHRTPFTVGEGFRVDVPMRARFIKDGYEIAVVDLPALEVGVVPRPLFVELPPGAEGAEAGTLMILSNPDGAEIWVDGNKQPGATPLTDVRVRGGEMHKVEFRMPGYKTRWETRFVEPGSRIFIEVNLFRTNEEPTAPAGDSGQGPNEQAGRDADPGAPSPPDAGPSGTKGKTVVRPAKTAGTPGTKRSSRAYLNISSAMKLRITVDNNFVGETPIKKLALDPGLHRIKAESPQEGFTLSHKIRVTGGRTETVDFKPRKGNLSINALPWAWVSIGKSSPAETPVRLEVYEGEYQVSFECPDGQRKKRNAKVSPGQTASVTINCRD